MELLGQLASAWLHMFISYLIYIELELSKSCGFFFKSCSPLNSAVHQTFYFLFPVRKLCRAYASS